MRQRANHGTERRMLDFRSRDIAARIFLAKVTLASRIPCEICHRVVRSMVVALVAGSNCFQGLDANLRSQQILLVLLHIPLSRRGMNEYMWAYRYYSLVQEGSGPINSNLLDTTDPPRMHIYGIIIYNTSSSPTINMSNDFYRVIKLDMMS